MQIFMIIGPDPLLIATGSHPVAQWDSRGYIEQRAEFAFSLNAFLFYHLVLLLCNTCLYIFLLSLKP